MELQPLYLHATAMKTESPVPLWHIQAPISGSRIQKTGENEFISLSNYIKRNLQEYGNNAWS